MCLPAEHPVPPDLPSLEEMKCAILEKHPEYHNDDCRGLALSVMPALCGGLCLAWTLS